MNEWRQVHCNIIDQWKGKGKFTKASVGVLKNKETGKGSWLHSLLKGQDKRVRHPSIFLLVYFDNSLYNKYKENL